MIKLANYLLNFIDQTGINVRKFVVIDLMFIQC